jgi:hypothetical protein
MGASRPWIQVCGRTLLKFDFAAAKNTAITERVGIAFQADLHLPISRRGFLGWRGGRRPAESLIDSPQISKRLSARVG